MEINVGPFTFRPRFGQGKANISWLRGMMRHMKPPIPLARIPATVAQTLDIRNVRVRCRVGLEEAASTALAVGAISLALQSIGIWLRRESAQKADPVRPEMDVKIVPVYDSLIFEFKAEIIVKGRVGQYSNLAARLALKSLRASMPDNSARKGAQKEANSAA
jgi:hypothetical protein